MTPPVAAHLLRSWTHDLPADAAFGGSRISSNAVYPFFRAGQPCYLRFAPRSEKPEGALAGEIAFIRFLRRRGYPAARLPPLRGPLRIRARSTGRG